MTKTIVIGDEEVKLTANAGVDFIYQQIFREDPLRIQAGLAGDPDAGAAAVPLFQKLGFVMAMMATRSPGELARLSVEDFYSWICQFERMDYIDAIPAISEVYNGQRQTSSKEKKSSGQ